MPDAAKRNPFHKKDYPKIQKRLLFTKRTLCSEMDYYFSEKELVFTPCHVSHRIKFYLSLLVHPATLAKG